MTYRPDPGNEVTPKTRAVFDEIFRRIDAAVGTLKGTASKADVVRAIAPLKQSVSLQQINGIPTYQLLNNGNSTPMKLQGSIIPTTNGSLTYTNDGTHINWAWTGLVVLWPNGDTTPIPDGTQGCSGLANSTTYKFYAYYDVILKNVVFYADATGVGTPAIAFAGAGSTLGAIAVQFDLRVPLQSAGMSAATTGGGAGPGGSGGGSACKHERMVVEAKYRGVVQIIDAEIGELIAGPYGWDKIRNKRISMNDTWVRMELSNKQAISVTPAEPLARAEHLYADKVSFVKAGKVCLEDILISREEALLVIAGLRVDKHVARAVSLETEGHEYFFGETSACVLSHNSTVIK